MMFKPMVKISAALLATLAFGAVGAQTLSATGNVLGTTTNYSLNGGAMTSYAPGREMTFGGGSPFWAFCIDPATNASLPSTYTTMSLATYLSGAANSAYQQQITRNNNSTGTASRYAGYGLASDAATQSRVSADLTELFSWAYTDAISSATKAAAFGMAVWEVILQDGGANGNAYVKTTGRLASYGATTTAYDAVDTQADAYLSALNNNTWTGLLGNTASAQTWNYTVYFDAGSPFSQTFIGVTTPAVPEPGTAALAALALVGAVGLSRRKGKV